MPRSSAFSEVIHRAFRLVTRLGDTSEQGVTRCPEIPRCIPGVTPIRVSSKDIAEGIERTPAPVTQFLFCTTIGDIESISGCGIVWRDVPVYEEWLQLRRFPGYPEDRAHLRIYLDLFAAIEETYN